ncbi:MAG: SPFH domain-containing protein [Xanthomonadaceae bacterium]|nr:SPFH domain-containing protein [Xanthomonadaceae bacterium]MDP2185290.1 SPFH domain-containing protein [Xanthomonadales bacterium]MDZ4115829.1 SPFH domain-containing protein [Xanthomonadaceae bacterium]MDZ4378658.1 SPFH domain-containing protein [Xanthomonadaceae bacterium]
MLGLRYVKSSPSHYLLQYRNGQIVREGSGLAFFYFAPRSTLVSVPLTAVDVPFMFEEITRDFQSVTLQGQVSYRIAEPKTLAQQLDFTMQANGNYASEDPQRLPVRVLNAVKAQFRALLQELDLREVLQGTERLAKTARNGLASAPSLLALGIEIGDLGLLAVKPNPETARALEAPMREQILKQADDATYTRRNAAIEQEQLIKESELRSELVVEQKKRQVRETQVESERVILEKKHQIQTQELAGKVELEQQNGELVQLRAENQKREAEVRAYAMQTMVGAMKGLDARSLQAMLIGQASPETLMALGFQNVADNAAKIGEFNFSPDILRQLARKAE